MKSKSLTLYNVIFPVFAIWLIIPQIFILVLLGNLIIDGAVISLGLFLNKAKVKVKKTLEFILKAWLFGLFADICGALLLFFIPVESINIWNDKLSLFVHVGVVLLFGYIIFLFNYHMLKKHKLEEGICLHVALGMGIITAPWFFLVPLY
ncbi:hypothetical protein ACFL3C_04755 [Patescibacteria group bacterium]